MGAIHSFGAWLSTTAPSQFVNNHSWVWPACETLHFMGLILLMGNVGLLDLRMLGLLKELPAKHLSRFVRWGVAGFIVNLLTGVVFIVGQPGQYFDNWAFFAKLVFILLAGLNVFAFYATGVSRQVDLLAAGDDAPPLAKFIAGTSLFLWVGVMYFGRMLPFLGNAF
jgi:Family of unknown function (DUF6644)